MNSQMVYQFKLPPAVNKCSVFPFFERIYIISGNCSWKRWNLSAILDYITLKTDDVELKKNTFTDHLHICFWKVNSINSFTDWMIWAFQSSILSFS